MDSVPVYSSIFWDRSGLKPYQLLAAKAITIPNKEMLPKPSNTNNSRLCRRLRGVLVLLPEYGVDV